jgi:hypothetical protein
VPFVRELRDKLARNHFVAVIGSSGSGKSSLVKAGLLPLLDREGAKEQPARWRWLVFRPGLDPINSLVQELLKIGRTIAPDLVSKENEGALADRWSAMLRRSSYGVNEIVTGLGKAARGNELAPRTALLVVVDQFEELFRYEEVGASNAAERAESARALVRALLTATGLPGAPIDVHVLITMRSDFIGDCVQFTGLPEAISASQFLVPRMTRDQRREAIVKPVAGQIEPSLVQELLNATDVEQDDLPLMQHALMRTWHKRSGVARKNGKPAALSLGTYGNIGGIELALSNHADELYGELLAAQPHRSAELSRVVEYMFRALTAVDLEKRAIRRPQRFADLVAMTGDEGLVRIVTDRLSTRDCSFLVCYVDALFGQEIVDVSHEALIRRWRRISDKTPDNESSYGRGWMYQEQRDAEIWRSLRFRAQEIQEDPAALLSEETTRRYNDWFERIPASSRRAWAERYEGGYDAVAELLKKSLDRLEKGEQFSARLGERNVDRFADLKSRADEAEASARRNFSKMMALRARDAIRNGEVRTGLIIAAEILAASARQTSAGGSSLSADLERGTAPPTGPPGAATPAAAAAQDTGSDQSRMVYVPEGEQAAYLALQRMPQSTSTVGTSREDGLPLQPAKFIKPVKTLPARPLHLSLRDEVVLDFGRDDTLLFAYRFRRDDAPVANHGVRSWHALTGSLVAETELDGRLVGGGRLVRAGIFTLSGRELTWKTGISVQASYALPDWLKGELFATVSPSANAVAVIDAQGRHLVLRLIVEEKSFDPAFEDRTGFERASRWQAAFSPDGQRLLALSDQFEGFGLEFSTLPGVRRAVEIDRHSDPGDRVIALDPARWRWARSVVKPGDWRITIGGGVETPRDGTIASQAQQANGNQTAGGEAGTKSGGVISLPTVDMTLVAELLSADEGASAGANVAGPSASSEAAQAIAGTAAADFSFDGTRLVLAPPRGPLLVYSVADASAPIAVLGSTHDRFVAVAFSPTGDRVAGVYDDGGAIIWPIFPNTLSLLGEARRALAESSGKQVALTASQRSFLGFEQLQLPRDDGILRESEVKPAAPIPQIEPQVSPMRPESQTMTSSRRCFIIMPFGKKAAADGTIIDFDVIYAQLLSPAVAAAGLQPHRADAERRGGSIHADMFQELLLAELVVADLTLDNPNVWYEIGVRYALRASGAVLTYAQRDRLPFDIAGQRMQRYTLKNGKVDPARVDGERAALTQMITATLGDWRGRRSSPVYQQLPNLTEPDWKSLKVGDVNEFWQSLEAWQSRIEVARRKQRPGDILLLAEETPNRVLEFEALRTAARALVQLNHPRYALTVVERARKIDPDDIGVRQIEAIALGRAQRFEEARESLQRLAEQRKDGETLGLLARTWKDEWTRFWNTHPQRKDDPLAAARDTAATLRSAGDAYVEAFRTAPADYYPGINALTLGRLWEHVTKRKSSVDLDLISAGVRWAVDCAIARNKDFWALVTRAELALVEGQGEAAIDGYSEAAAQAVTARDRFSLDSASQQLDFLDALGFRPDIVSEAAHVINRAERQLDALLGGPAAGRIEPKHVVLFSGHMIDNPAKRGPGKPSPARFPATKVEAVNARIRKALEEIGAGTGDLGLCGGASGGDLLFAEACLARGMRLEVRLARSENEFLAESVTFSDPDRRWEQSFAAVTSSPATTVLTMPEELGPTPDSGDSVHDRRNRWMLYSTLSYGLGRTSFVALWNGEPGDGPGGTQHMVELVKKLTGRQPIIIDPGKL